MTKKQIKNKIQELEFYLGMTKHRAANMFPGPGIREDIDKLEKEITELKRALKGKK